MKFIAGGVHPPNYLHEWINYKADNDIHFEDGVDFCAAIIAFTYDYYLKLNII